MEDKVVKVKILGKEYPLKGDLDENLIHEVADLVNTKMQNIATAFPIGSFQKIAVLTCLNIATELILLKNEKSKPDPFIEKRIQSLIEVIEQLQNESAST